MTPSASKCPAPREIMSWLDGETHETYIEEHLRDCTACSRLAEGLRRENNLLKSVFAELPRIPDLSARVMSRLAGLPRRLNPLEAAGAYILIVSAGLLVVLVNYYLTVSLFVPHGPQLLSVLKSLTFLTDVFLSLRAVTEYALSAVFSAQPLLPAVLVTLLLVLINIFNKRRYSNV